MANTSKYFRTNDLGLVFFLIFLGFGFFSCSQNQQTEGNLNESLDEKFNIQMKTTTPAIVSTLPLTASVNDSTHGFTKYLYSYPLPTGSVQWEGLSGSISLTLISGRYSEALITVHYLPSGACPLNGATYTTYEQISTAYPGMRSLENLILKQPSVGTSTISVNESLPVSIKISGCVVLIMDGGPASGSAHINMTSHLVLKYSHSTPSQPNPYILGSGSEFCFGQTFGCQASTVNPARSFSYAVEVPADSYLLALKGDISNSSFDGQAPFGSIPTGSWMTHNNYYLLPSGCGNFPLGSSQAGDFYSLLPSDAIPLLNVSMQGDRMGKLQTPIYKTFGNLGVYKGQCILALVRMTGGGAVDTENQVSYLFQSAKLPPRPPPPAPPSIKLHSIYRLYNGSDHMLSKYSTEGTAVGYHLEGKAFSVATISSANLHPLYRCRSGAGHFTSVSSTCEGAAMESIIGFALGTSGSGVFPLFRFSNSNGFHLETTNYGEGVNSGFHYEGVLGYVWP